MKTNFALIVRVASAQLAQCNIAKNAISFSNLIGVLVRNPLVCPEVTDGYDWFPREREREKPARKCMCGLWVFLIIILQEIALFDVEC